MKAQHCKVSMIYLYWFGPSNFNFWPYLLPTAKRRKRCGQCTGCKTKDCGQCKFCKDMPKFGGLGRKKKPCIFRKVLVKCRQNVANKLFITCVFNPVRPHTWLTVLSALLRLYYWTLSRSQTRVRVWLRETMSKRGRGKLFPSVRYMQNLHTIVL